MSVWDLQTGQPRTDAQGDGTEIAALCFAGGHRDQVFAITVGNTLLDWPDGKTVRRTVISDEELLSTQCLPDRPLWRTVSEGNTIIEVNLGAPVPTSRTLFRLNARGSEFSADGRYIVGVDHEMFTADVTDLEHKSTRRVKLAGRPVPINMIQANADGSLLAIMEAGAPQIRLYRTKADLPRRSRCAPGMSSRQIQRGFFDDRDFLTTGRGRGRHGSARVAPHLRAAAADGGAVFPVAFDRGGHVLLAVRTMAMSSNGIQTRCLPPIRRPRCHQPRRCAGSTLWIANRQFSDAEVRDLLDGQPPARTCASVTQIKKMSPAAR